MTQFSGIGIVSPEFRISERGLNWKYRHYEEVLNRSENLASMEGVEERPDGEDLNPIKHIGAPSCINADPLFLPNSLELFVGWAASRTLRRGRQAGRKWPRRVSSRIAKYVSAVLRATPDSHRSLNRDFSIFSLPLRKSREFGGVEIR